MSLKEETERNAALKATLASLLAPTAEEVVVESESQKKAASAMKVIDMQEKELEISQKVARAETMIKHLQAEIKEDTNALKTVQSEIDKEKSKGKAVWETVGISTVTYRDPFHTGLSKRTPTGARPAHAARASPPLDRLDHSAERVCSSSILAS